MQLKPGYECVDFHEQYLANLPKGHSVVTLHLDGSKSTLFASRVQAQADSIQLRLLIDSDKR